MDVHVLRQHKNSSKDIKCPIRERQEPPTSTTDVPTGGNTFCRLTTGLNIAYCKNKVYFIAAKKRGKIQIY
jgi:hypothetical protein